MERSVVASDLRATVFAVGVARFNLRATRTTAVDRGLDGCVRGVLDLATAATVDVWLRNVGNVVLGMTVLASDQTHAHDSITIATNPKFRLARRCRLDAERSRKAVHCLMGLSSHCLDRQAEGCRQHVSRASNSRASKWKERGVLLMFRGAPKPGARGVAPRWVLLSSDFQIACARTRANKRRRSWTQKI